MKYNLSDYFLRIWITTMLIGPISMLFISLQGDLVSAVEIFLIAFVMGCLCSLPCLLLLYLGCRSILKYVNNSVIVKSLLTILAIILCYVPFLILNNFDLFLDKDMLSKYLFASYSLAIGFSVWFYRLETRFDEGLKQDGTLLF